MSADPLAQFSEWYEHAVAAGVVEPEAMALATATADGAPSVRFVLLKGIDERGVEFFTNYESRKGRELIANPRAALAMLWKPLQRQVRLEGPVEVLTPEESDAYFASRSRGSQLGAWASRQSEAIPDREWLEARLAEVDAAYPETVPRPPHWGGFRLLPRRDRVLGGPPAPPARPRGVHPRRGRRLALAAALAVAARCRSRLPRASISTPVRNSTLAVTSAGERADASGPTPQQPPTPAHPRRPALLAAAPGLGDRVVGAAGVRVGDQRQVGHGADAARAAPSTNSGAVQFTPTATTFGDDATAAPRPRSARRGR